MEDEDKIAEAIHHVARAIEELSNTFFQTLGSEKTGDYLDGVPAGLDNIADAITKMKDE